MTNPYDKHFAQARKEIIRINQKAYGKRNELYSN